MNEIIKPPQVFQFEVGTFSVSLRFGDSFLLVLLAEKKKSVKKRVLP